MFQVYSVDCALSSRFTVRALVSAFVATLAISGEAAQRPLRPSADRILMLFSSHSLRALRDPEQLPDRIGQI